jgi:hypothetical protein
MSAHAHQGLVARSIRTRGRPHHYPGRLLKLGHPKAGTRRRRDSRGRRSDQTWLHLSDPPRTVGLETAAQGLDVLDENTARRHQGADWMNLGPSTFEVAHPFTNRAAPLHMRFCRSVADVLVEVPSEAALQEKPLGLRFRPSGGSYLPVRVNLYAFKATQHVSERQAGTFRIQLSHVERSTGGRRHYFDRSDATSVLLAGYTPHLDVWILWDADLHDRDGFTYSRGLQAHPDLVYGAASRGVEEVRRTLKKGVGSEVVVAATSARLTDGVNLRFRRAFERMTGAADGTS